MADINPLVEDAPLPRFSAIEPAHVGPAIDGLMAEYGAAVDALTASSAPRTWESVMHAQEVWAERMSRAWAPVSHLHSVRDTPELRKAYGDTLERITDFETELGQNRALYQAVQAVADSPEFARLLPAQRKIVDDALRDFRLSGVALEEPDRSRFKAIATELSKLSTEFEQAVLDATDAWHRDVADESALAGIPEAARAMMREAAKEAGVEGWRVTLKQPSYVAALTYAQDRSLRSEVYAA
ncbi:MAG TPA: oligopeptidase A, partial [Candidatus Saccharimonadia bacterium]|nr:oligopeptidase A [Candidatus Saccharimonadia bacterium]